MLLCCFREKSFVFKAKYCPCAQPFEAELSGENSIFMYNLHFCRLGFAWNFVWRAKVSWRSFPDLAINFSHFQPIYLGQRPSWIRFYYISRVELWDFCCVYASYTNSSNQFSSEAKFKLKVQRWLTIKCSEFFSL